MGGLCAQTRTVRMFPHAFAPREGWADFHLYVFLLTWLLTCVCFNLDVYIACAHVFVLVLALVRVSLRSLVLVGPLRLSTHSNDAHYNLHLSL